MLLRVLLRIADKKIAIDILDAERCKAWRDVRIGEAAFDFLTRCWSKASRTIRGKNVNLSRIKVGRKEKYTPWIGPEDEAFVHRAASGIVDGDDCVTGVWNRSRPGGNRSVLCGEYERCGDAWRAGAGDDECGSGVPDEAGRGGGCRRRRICLRRSRLAGRTGHGIIGQRDRNLERYLYPGTVVKGRATRGVIGDPEGARARGERHAPRVPQYRVLELGCAILVGD